MSNDTTTTLQKPPTWRRMPPVESRVGRSAQPETWNFGRDPFTVTIGLVPDTTGFPRAFRGRWVLGGIFAEGLGGVEELPGATDLASAQRVAMEAVAGRLEGLAGEMRGATQSGGSNGE